MSVHVEEKSRSSRTAVRTEDLRGAGTVWARRAPASAPHRAGAAQLTAAALEAIRWKGSETLAALERLRPCAREVDPFKAVELLIRAAVNDDVASIEKLFDVFGSFEMPSLALCYAIAMGHDASARTLLAHGVTLRTELEPSPQSRELGSLAQRQERYINELLCTYYGRGGIPGRQGFLEIGPRGYIYLMTLSEKSDPLIAAYAREGLLCPRDLKGLMLACLAESFRHYLCGAPRPELAQLLADAGGINGEAVCLHVIRGPYRQQDDVEDIDDLLFPGCSPIVARYVCAHIPERIADLWDVRYLEQDPRVVRMLVPHLDPQRLQSIPALLDVLARNGFDDAVKTVCDWQHGLTAQDLVHAIELASGAGRISTAALLMDIKNESFGAAAATSLEL